MNKKELIKILKDHKKWLYGNGKKRADLHDADLHGADLHGADLRFAELREASLHGADFHDANLYGADLHRADLHGANLRGANLDYSCIPLWCGSLKAHFDDKQIIQIVYHAVKAGLCSKNTSDEVKNELRKLISLANRFHMVNTCGKIEEG